MTKVYPKPFLYLTWAVLLLRTIPAGMVRYPIEERPHEDFSSEEREARRAGAVFMFVGGVADSLGCADGLAVCVNYFWRVFPSRESLRFPQAGLATQLMSQWVPSPYTYAASPAFVGWGESVDYRV